MTFGGNRPSHRDNRPRTALWGATLLVVGVAALVGNALHVSFGALWPLVFVLPALWALISAASAARQAGAFTPLAARFALGGVAFALLGATFWLKLAWPIVGPLFLLLLGASALTATRRP